MKKKTNKGIIRKAMRLYATVSVIYTGYQFVKARGTAKENDKLLISNALDRITGYDVDCDDTITIGGTVLHVSYNPYMHLFMNSLGCIACIINESTDVYTDARFREMHEPTQYAILCHEMGHRKCNHNVGVTYQLDRIKAVMNNKVLPIELEADEYAVSIVGPYSMYMALKELSLYTKGFARKEVHLRMKHIKDKYQLQ